jgi:hypothetical protein
MGATIKHHCSLCFYLHDTDCPHIRPNAERAAPPSLVSGSSYYTAHTSESTFYREKPITVRIIDTRKQRPNLRHKTRNSDMTLRQLREKQSQQLSIRAKHSEDRLQQAYEAQILAYLDSPLSSKDSNEVR